MNAVASDALPPAAAASGASPPAAVKGAPMIEARGVSKQFGDLVAVSNVTFGLGAGVTALLGPNGAGKSTLLRMLSGLAKPSSGEVRVLGKNLRDNIGLRSHVGLVPQQEQLFEHMRIGEFVCLAADLCGVADSKTMAEKAISLVGLDPGDKRRLSTYSKGMRQRVKVAQAIVHEPSVLFLDEPLAGLDPPQRSSLIDLFHMIADAGRCVVVSSHVLEEVQRMGSRVLIMGNGRLLAEGDYKAIRDLMNDRPRRFGVAVDHPREFAASLFSRGLISYVEIGPSGALQLATQHPRDFFAGIAPIAQEQGITLSELRPLDADLESVFLYLLGRR